MHIRFDHSPFVPSVTELLKELSALGFFHHGLLIGSWPMSVYAEHFTLPYGLATNDIDFAVAGVVKMPEAPRETIPELMQRLGYTPLPDYTGIETFIQGEFEVEFLTHRRGGGGPPAVTVKPWQVSAQPLPFIDLLFIRPAEVSIGEFTIAIPSPEALMIHKLIIAQRRTGSDKENKKSKDLYQCEVLNQVAREEEVQRVLAEYPMSKDVRRAIETSCREAELTVPGGLPWLASKV